MKIPFITKYFGGSYIGGLMDTYGRASMIISGVQFVFVVIILYTTSLRPFLDVYAPWVTFTLYVAVAIVSIIILMVLTRLLVVPSAYTFTNRQVWDNNNPMRDKLEKLEKNQMKIMEKMGIEDK